MEKREYLNSLTQREIDDLKRELHKQRGGLCYICREPINPAAQRTDIDHIIALKLEGSDGKHNLAITHAGCNRSKGIRDLQLQRYIADFRKLVDKKLKNGTLNEMITVGDILIEYNGSSSEVALNIDKDFMIMSYEVNNKPSTLKYNSLEDEQDSKFKSFVGMLPKEVIFHDPDINPRSIVDLEPMIEEFYQKRPQLQPSLAYIELNNNECGKIKLFDGQHKAAAQLLNGADKLFVRTFINPPLEELVKTNFRAHTKLAQIHFPQLISDKVAHSIFEEEFKKYINSIDLEKGSEKKFIDSLPADMKTEYRNYLKGYIKYDVLSSNAIMLMKFVETVSSRSKKYPLSFESLRRGLLEIFLYLKPSAEPLSATQLMREKEKVNLQQLMNIIAEEILIDKFKPLIGIFKIEQRLRNNDPHITTEHLLAYRMLRQAPLIAWAEQFRDAVSTFINSKNKYQKDWHKEKFLWADLDDNDFKIIRNMIRFIKSHPSWTVEEENLVNQISTTKVNDWRLIINEGKLPGVVDSLYSPMNSGEILSNAVKMQ
jgi:hypothetical protein